MRELSPQELSQLLSAYLDGALEDSKAQELELYVRANPKAQKELSELRSLKGLIAKRDSLTPDSAFWTRLSARIAERDKEEENLLPFPRRFVPAVAAAAVMLVVAGGVLLIQNRSAVEQFLTETTEQVQEAYENSILKGSIFPLFTNISKDQVLQFAMFGALPLDANAGTTLQVDELASEGYKIELGRGSQPKANAVTVKQFVEEVQPTPIQARAIDSVLENARRKIEAAVLVSENNALAVDPALSRLNKVVLSEIVECLEPPQLAKMERFLEFHRVPFAINVRTEAQKIAREQLKHRPSAAPDQFLVITADTIARITINVEAMQRHAVHVYKEVESSDAMHERVQNLVRHFREREAEYAKVMRRVMPHVTVSGDENVLEIQFKAEWESLQRDSGEFLVRSFPRIPMAPRPGVRVTSSRPRVEMNDTFDFNMEFDSLTFKMFDQRGEEIIFEMKEGRMPQVRVQAPLPLKKKSIVRDSLKD